MSQSCRVNAVELGGATDRDGVAAWGHSHALCEGTEQFKQMWR